MVTLPPLADLGEPLDDLDRGLLSAIQQGLPLVARPYAAIATKLGVEEGELLRRLQRLLDSGIIRRLGVVVRHHELGYLANAMVVWDIPDTEVDELGHRLGAFPGITLCYRRPRRPPLWPYNLFTMIHGRDRDEVLDRLARLLNLYDLGSIPHEVLFSRRRFKQRGARYDLSPTGLPREGRPIRLPVPGIGRTAS